MKRAVIVHCWGGKPNYAWYPWAKAELEKAGYQVAIPDMPNTDTPQFAEWLPYLTETIGEPDDELVLIGHSLGSPTILHYLQGLKEDQQVGKVIMVAGFTDSLETSELASFFAEPFNFDKIKTKSKNGFVVIQSDDDPYIAAKYGTQLQNELGARLVIKHGAKHMSGPVEDVNSCTELPEVMQGLKT